MSTASAATSISSEGARHHGSTRPHCDRSRAHTQPASDQVVTSLDDRRARRTLPPPTPSQIPIELDVWRLHVAYARTGDEQVRAELVEIYTGYATSLARRMHRDGEPLADLVQVAMEALLLAIERFDPERRLPFPAFATPTIVGSLKRHYRDLGWSMRVPRRIHEIAAPVRDTADRLTLELKRSPLVSEVAKELGLSESQVLEAQEAAYARSLTSLDAPVGEDSSRFDALGSIDPEFGRSDNRMALHQALGDLSERERTLVQLYFVDEMTQSEIGDELGVSQMQVSRWLAATIRRLRDRMATPA